MKDFQRFLQLMWRVLVTIARFWGIRQGRRFSIYAKLRGVDTVETANRVIACIEAEKPDAIIVDGDGLGAGVCDQLRHLGYGAGLHEFHGGSRAADVNKY